MNFFCDKRRFSSPSRKLLSSRRSAQAGVKEEYRVKVVILYRYLLVWRKNSKLLQIGTNMLLIITSTSDKFFSRVNIDDLQ